MADTIILWVHDRDLNGPINGLASRNGEELWFQACGDVTVPAVVPSVELLDDAEESFSDDDSWPEAQDDDVDTFTRSYKLLRLSSADLQMVTGNHISQCLALGMPLYHGDAYKAKEVKTVVKAGEKELAPLVTKEEEAEVILAKPVSMNTVNAYKHSFDPATLTGEEVATIEHTEFSNYYIPHIVA